MPENTDFLKDYVQVKDRVRELFELYGQARIETTYEITREPDDKPKVIARAVVYRNAEDTLPAGTGTSWLYLPGTTNFTKGSEIENAETSAVGRAIGFLGILTEKGMATANEIAAKSDDTPARPAPEHLPPRDGSLIGEAAIGKAPADYELRETPDGWALSFKLTAGRQQIRVIASDDLAQALSLVRDDVIGSRVVCFGRMTQEYWTVNKGKPDERKIPFTQLALSRIETPTIILPAAPEPDTVPLFDESEIDALPALA